jgi:hypothetical protein
MLNEHMENKFLFSRRGKSIIESMIKDLIEFLPVNHSNVHK